MNKFFKLSEKELVEILNRGDLNQQDFVSLKEAMERKGMTGMIMRVGNDFDDAEAPMKAAREYIKHHEKIPRQVSKKEIEHWKKILLSKIADLENKKTALVTLAHVADQAVFEVLKKYHEQPDKELRVWSELACQECRSFLKSEIFDEAGIEVSSLSGTKDGKMRFYFIFKTLGDELVTPEVKKNTNKILNEIVDLFDCEIEDAKFDTDHMVITALLPFDVPPAEFAEAAVAFGNRESFVWHGDFYVNNTHLPNKKDISDFLVNSPH